MEGWKDGRKEGRKEEREGECGRKALETGFFGPLPLLLSFSLPTL